MKTNTLTIEDEPEEPEESSEAEMGKFDIIPTIHLLTLLTERLKGDWNALIYAFFHPVPTIGYEKGR